MERPPHYDTFAEFQYSYHYGDSYIPHIHQEEPLKMACQHFVDCIATGAVPITGGREGLEMIQILEAASASLKANGAPVTLSRTEPKISQSAAQGLRVVPGTPEIGGKSATL